MEFLSDICLNLFCSLNEGIAGLFLGISGLVFAAASKLRTRKQ